MIVEKSFPRGGIPVKESKAQTNKKDNIIFGALQKKFKKSKNKKSTTDLEDLLEQQKDDIIETRSAELLSYETIQDDMLIVGIVSSVDDLYVTVSLPGRMTARISALEISDAYTKTAKEFLENPDQVTNYKSLQELFEIGQLVYGRVQEVKQNKFGRPQIVMTFKPSEVHAELSHTNVRKGFNFNGAIEEVQEHGYIIESGIKGLRAFLPLEKSQKNLAQGQLIYLKVEKVTIDKTASTCICKQVQVDQLKIKSLQVEPNIDYILPSTIVSFKVDKCLKDGLQGTIMNEAFTAYVNEHQLGEPLMLPEDYEINESYDARILYVMPLTKLVYLTLNLRKSNSTNVNESKVRPFERGDVIENARVHHLGTGGVILVLNNEVKGLISYKTIKANYKGNYDHDELLSKYSKQSKHKVRILNYDMMDSLYFCSDDTKIVNEKCFSLQDLKPGDFTTAVVKSYNQKLEGYAVQIGNVKGIIEKLYLTPSTKQYEPNTKLRCRIVAVSEARKLAYLTNRAEYMDKDAQLLLNVNEIKKNSIFVGTIVNVNSAYYLVRFFNDITAVLFKSQLREEFLSGNSDDFSLGQTMNFRILRRKEGKITLALADDVCELGELYNGTISHVLETGLEVNVEIESPEENSTSEKHAIKGLIPLRLLSDFQDLLLAKARSYAIGKALKMTSIRRNIFSVRDVKYFQEQPPKNWKSIQVGDVLRAYVENVNDDVIDLSVAIRGYKKLVKIHLKMLLLHAYKDSNVVLSPEQVIYVKVLGKVDATKTISVSALLTMVWDQQLSSTADYVESYLQEISDIQKELKKEAAPISHFAIGDKISVIFQGVDSESKDWHFVENAQKLPAIAKASILTGTKLKQPKPGTKQEAIILWVDYSNDLIYISPKVEDMKHIKKCTKLPEEFQNTKHFDAKMLLKLEHVFICSLKKGPSPLVFCPIRLHYNDFENSASATIKEGDFCKLNFIHKTKPIAVLHETWKLWQNVAKSKRKKDKEPEVSATPAKKKKLEKEDDVAVEVMKPVIESKAAKVKKSKAVKDIEEVKPKKVKLETAPSSNLLFYEDTTPSSTAKKPTLTPTKKSLAGISDFWATNDLSQLNETNNDESSDDDDDEGNDNGTVAEKQKKKKLSTVEKFKQQRSEEARLREIEAQYADPNHLPETVDQFDRLVLSEPNSSKLWINYMVFHLQAAEIEKARAVARRALKAISMRNSDDHLNIWVALLNLEIRYGSRDTFDSTLKEALTLNEPIKIYLRVVEILREVKKNQELIEIVNIITKKFKTVQEVWKSSADAYFSAGLTDQAQQMLHKAVASLPERDHVNTIVMFANLNHRHGCNEMAQTLLDQVVTSYPKRVDVWTQYVDMLVKDQLIESARSVLERAILQNIPLKKMRTIFKKYLEFEERHGTEADVEKVKRLATEYVKNNANI